MIQRPQALWKARSRDASSQPFTRDDPSPDSPRVSFRSSSYGGLFALSTTRLIRKQKPDIALPPRTGCLSPRPHIASQPAPSRSRPCPRRVTPSPQTGAGNNRRKTRSPYDEKPHHRRLSDGRRDRAPLAGWSVRFGGWRDRVTGLPYPHRRAVARILPNGRLGFDPVRRQGVEKMPQNGRFTCVKTTIVGAGTPRSGGSLPYSVVPSLGNWDR